MGSIKIAEGLRRLAEQLELEAADAERNETIASSHVTRATLDVTEDLSLARLMNLA